MTIPLEAFAFIILATIVLVWWRPQWTILLPLVVHAGAQVKTILSLGFLTLPTTLLETTVLMAIGTAAFRYRSSVWTAPWRLPRVVLLAVAAFLVAATVSALIAPHPHTAWGQWKASIVEPILYVAALLPLLRAEDGRTRIVRALLLGGMVSAGLSLAAGAISFIPTLNYLPTSPVTFPFSRLAGIYDAPNVLVMVLAPLVALAAATSLRGGSGATDAVISARGLLHHLVPRNDVQTLARLSLVCMVPALLWTRSFGGIIAAAVGSWWGIWHVRKVEKYPLSTPDSLNPRSILLPTAYCLLPIAIALLLLSRSGRISHVLSSESPLISRFQIWAVSLRLIQDHPILGTGLGTFEPAYQEKLRELLAKSPGTNRSLLPTPDSIHPPKDWLAPQPHSLMLAFWLNTGLLGVLSAGLLGGYALLKRGPLGAAGVALVAILLVGLTDTPYFRPDLSLLFWVLIASQGEIERSHAMFVDRTG